MHNRHVVSERKDSKYFECPECGHMAATHRDGHCMRLNSITDTTCPCTRGSTQVQLNAVDELHEWDGVDLWAGVHK